jgi:hypothetical protein
MKTLESAREDYIRAENKNGNGSNCSRSPFGWVEYFSNSSLAAPSTARMTPTPKNQDVFQVSIITGGSHFYQLGHHNTPPNSHHHLAHPSFPDSNRQPIFLVRRA